MRQTALLGGWLFFTAVLAFSFAYSPASNENRASAIGPVRVALSMQGSLQQSVQCSNDHSFCRADVARCEGNQRDQIEWRKECRTRYDRAFRECAQKLAPFRPAINMGYRPEHFERIQREYEERKCGHTRRGVSQCEIEVRPCPTFKSCEQQYRACVHDQGQPGGYEEPELPPPANPTPVERRSEPRPASKGAYRVSISNRCDQAISVAYLYSDPDGNWRKSGWLNVAAGRTERVDDPIGRPRLGVHSTIGFPRSANRVGSNRRTDFVNRGFDVPIEQTMQGEGARSVPFEMVELPAGELNPAIEIDYCDSYRWGERTAPVKQQKSALEIEATERLYLQMGDGLYDRMSASIAAGADVNAQNPGSRVGWTPLFRAAQNWDGRAFDLLIRAGANPRVTDFQRNTLYHVAVRPTGFVRKFDPAFFVRLDAANVPANTANAQGKTPLYIHASHLAERGRTHETHDALLSHLVKVARPLRESRYAGGMTLLHVAARIHDVELAAQLLQAGWVDSTTDDMGKLAIDYAAEKSEDFRQIFVPKGMPAPQAVKVAHPALPLSESVERRPLTPEEVAAQRAAEARRLEALRQQGIAP